MAGLSPRRRLATLYNLGLTPFQKLRDSLATLIFGSPDLAYQVVAGSMRLHAPGAPDACALERDARWWH